MPAKENKAIIYKVYDEFNKGNYDVIDEYFSDNFTLVRHNGESLDREGFKQLLIDMTKGFSDIQRNIENVVVSDDRGALFFMWEGTDKWEYEGRTPTGNRIKVREIYFVCFEDGKISEYWQYSDSCNLAYQLGMLKEIVH
jgi:predicted ester cyclase